MVNVLFLSFRNDVRTSAGGKRTYHQADYLQTFFRVGILFPKAKSIGLSNVQTYIGYVESFKTLWRIRRKYKRNILIIGTLIDLNNLPFVLFAKICGYRIILDKVENYSVFTDKQSLRNNLKIKFGLFIDRYLLEYLSDGLMVISTQLLSYYTAFSKPKILFPNAIPLSERTFTRREECRDTINVVYAGTFGEKDGVDLLVKAFLKIVEGTTKKIFLHLVGRGTLWNERMIKELTRGHSNIIWHGFVGESELQEILMNADVLTMTRRDSKYAQFGFPYKITEYLTTRNPILATKVGDVENYLTHLVDAYLVNPDLGEIIEGLHYCIYNNLEMRRNREMRGEEALKHFDIKILGPQLGAFINEIIGANG